MAEVPGLRPQSCNASRLQVFFRREGSMDKGGVEIAGPSVSPFPYIQWCHPHVREDGVQDHQTNPNPSLSSYIIAARFTSSTLVHASEALHACNELHGEIPPIMVIAKSQSR